MASVVAERAAVATWPETGATLYRLKLVEQRSGRGPGVHFRPYINYRYTIGSRTYEGDTLTYDDSWRHVFGAANSRDFQSNLRVLVPTLDYERFRKAPACQNIPAYESCEFTYELNQPIRIHYDPEQLYASVVERRTLVPLDPFEYILSPLVWIVSLLMLARALAVSAWALANDDWSGPSVQYNRSSPSMFAWFHALGVIFFAICVEMFNVNIGWRGTITDSEQTFAYVATAIIIGLFAVAGIYLILKPIIDRLFGWDRRRRKR
jgi:hypothetical protein